MAEVMKDMNQRLAGMEKGIKAGGTSEPPIVIQGGYDMLNGPALADFVVEKYQTGNLGLKTIWRAFLAWLKYKL